MSNSDQNLFEHAVQLHSDGQISAAITAYGQAITQYPDLAEAFYNRALAYLELDEQQALALADLNTAIELQPTLADAYFCRGLLGIDSQQYEAALKDFNLAADYDSFSPAPAINRGAIYCLLKDYAQAQAEYDSAAAVWPDHALLRFNQALVYAEQGTYQTALDIINSIEPDDTDPWPWLKKEIPKIQIDLEASIRTGKNPPGFSYLRQVSLVYSLHE